MDTIEIRTPARVAFVDITSRVKHCIAASGITEGVAVVFVPHTTAGVTINEAADPSVVEDMMNSLSRLVPYRADYRHSEGNSDAHIKASMMGSSVNLIISEGVPVLGTWQGVFFCEFDGPRTRRIHVTAVPR